MNRKQAFRLAAAFLIGTLVGILATRGLITSGSQVFQVPAFRTLVLQSGVGANDLQCIAFVWDRKLKIDTEAGIFSKPDHYDVMVRRINGNLRVDFSLIEPISSRQRKLPVFIDMGPQGVSGYGMTTKGCDDVKLFLPD